MQFIKTPFEIECRYGGHSVTKKFKTILQTFVAKAKSWKYLYFYKQYMVNVRNHFFFLLKRGEKLLGVPKMVNFRENLPKKLDARLLFFLCLMYIFEANGLKICKTIHNFFLELFDFFYI